jgi:SAM-dependent methyltransferase
MDPAHVQAGNQAWWTRNTMSYDWRDPVAHSKYSAEWFDEVDGRFIHAARLFATDTVPFDRLIPFEALKGRRVLEIGCGMGLHTELMVRAGAKVTAFDLSPESVQATKRRLALKGLQATVQQGDAERLPFADGSFDFVWSWGVIHHSSRTARIAREIGRVLADGGETRVMVYNRTGIVVPITFVRSFLLKGRFLKDTFEEVLYESTDGFSARFYVPEQFADLFRAFFEHVDTQVCGQDSDAVPLPARVRALALRFVPENWLRKQQARWGHFIFLTAKNPTRS